MRVKLGEVVNRITGNVDRFNTDLKYYVGGEHYESSALAIYTPGLLDSEKGKVLGFKFHFPFQAEDVLFMARNPHLRKAAKVTFDGICSDASYILRSKDESVLLQSYLPLVIQCDEFWDFFEENKSGSVNYLMNWKELQKYEFELPPIEQQKTTADVIWAIEKTRQEYRQLLKETDEMVAAHFIRLFGEPEENPKNWPVGKLSDIADSFIGLTYKPADVTDEGTVVLRSSNIQNSQLDFDDIVRVTTSVKEKLFVKENDILMCSRNGSADLVGKVARIPKLEEEMTFGAFMSIIRSEYHDYLFTYFQLPAFRRQIQTGTSTINQITQKMLSNITIPIPPIEKVRPFEEILRQSDKAKESLNQALLDLDILQKSIMSKPGKE